jgi:hypothetical protein
LILIFFQNTWNWQFFEKSKEPPLNIWSQVTLYILKMKKIKHCSELLRICISENQISEEYFVMHTHYTCICGSHERRTNNLISSI